MATDHKQIFNDDLMIDEGSANINYGSSELAAALDWPELRSAFAMHDTKANLAKSAARRRGISAVIAALAALWLAILELGLKPLVHFSSEIAVVIASAVLTLSAASLILGSQILVGERKAKWLHHRAATERMRQLHFQLLVRRATHLAAADPDIVQAVLVERGRLLDRVQREFDPRVSRPMHAIVEDLGNSECWLVKGLGPVPLKDRRQAVLDGLFQAYVLLRFRHQMSYATRQVARGSGAWPREPGGQARVVEVSFLWLTLLVLLCHAGAVIALATLGEAGGYAGGEKWIAPALHIMGLLAAMGVLALRVLEDGLRPRREVGRLRAYRAEVAELLRRFEATTNSLTRLELMESMEELAYRELREFLAQHEEASFVL